MIIFPLSHESGQVRRMPYITIGIIILNTLLYLITWYAEPKSREEFYRRSNELSNYYIEHTYLEVPQDVLNSLPPELQMKVKGFKELSVIPGGEAVLKTGKEAEDDAVKASEQEEMNRLIKELDDASNNQFYRKYGYIPSEGGFFSLFSSMFLHGGFFHLFFNMFFLYLSGCNIEDLWGRILYPAFYLIGGIVASLTHAMMNPDSTAPLVSASGAIAALMGAFMVRLYNTKIFFFYAIFMGRFKTGTFRAPAYIMLPLWLVQQLLEAFSSGNTGSGVAFWANIGGFIFGAAVAGGLKYFKFEEKYIEPALEDKMNLVDKDFTSGSKKLQEGDIDGAVLDLRKAIVNDPDNAIAHSDLCRAYCRQGKKKVALLEFHRAMDLYTKRGETDNIADDYLDVCNYYPDTMLETPRILEMIVSMKNREMFTESAAMCQKLLTHLKEQGDKENSSNVLELAMQIIVAMENKSMYSEAAAMCQKLLAHLKSLGAKDNNPDVLELTMRYGDLCLDHLQNPQDALKSYKIIFEYSKNMPLEQLQELKAKIQQATKLSQQETKKAEVPLKEKAKEKDKTSPSADDKPQIPLQKRIKLVQDAKVPAKYKIASVAPHQANKVTAVSNGMNLNRLSEEPVLFDTIYALCVLQFQKDISLIHLDIFIRGKARPFRISSNQVLYSEFLSDCKSNSFHNFRQFILHIISQINSVYLDQRTMDFLKTGKPGIFQSQEDLELHEKNLWAQIMGEARFQCEKCYEVYWVDGRKIPDTGAKTKCKKCGTPVFIKKDEG